MSVDDAQAAYWQGPVSRSEVQAALDEQAQALVAQQEQLMKLGFSIGFLMEKFQVTQAEVQSWMDKKLVEFQALKASETPDPLVN